MPPFLLIIRDGWGHREEREGNAVLAASTPVHDRLLREWPTTLIEASGEAVGLPAGQMGNSEVGHLNLGAGRIVFQELLRIGRAIEDGSFFRNPALLRAMARARGSALHLLGLVSDGGVHSHLRHLFALLKMARGQGVRRVLVHAFTDGRDTAPDSGRGHLRALDAACAEAGARVATVSGRFFAMDRDRRWDRIEKAWRAMALGQAARAARSGEEAAALAYAAGETDEFITPTVVEGPAGAPEGRVEKGDVTVMFNFRADRARQITRAFKDRAFDGFPRPADPDPAWVSMTVHDETFPFPAAYPPERFSRIFGEVVAERGLGQLRAAETEKYAHVTYFFNGGEERPFPGEERKLVDSPKVKTYDLQPEMSALPLTEEVLSRLGSGRHAAAILNYANPDLVGHTGVMEAAVKAVETVDGCVGRILAKVEAVEGFAIVTADHGNCEVMIDPVTKGPHTAHTTNPVHLHVVGPGMKGRRLRSGGRLCDVAPTLLELMGIPAPEEMTGKSLLERL